MAPSRRRIVPPPPALLEGSAEYPAEQMQITHEISVYERGDLLHQDRASAPIWRSMMGVIRFRVSSSMFQMTPGITDDESRLLRRILPKVNRSFQSTALTGHPVVMILQQLPQWTWPIQHPHRRFAHRPTIGRSVLDDRAGLRTRPLSSPADLVRPRARRVG